MSLGQLVLELKLDGNQFTVNLKQAQGQLGQFVLGAQRANSVIRQAESGTRKWGNVIRDTVIGLALARDAIRTLGDVTFGWQKAIISTNSEMEKSIALMRNFSKQKDTMIATQEAVGDVTKLLARASTSPFNLTSITDAFVKLRVGGVDPVFKSLDTLVDSVAAFGGSGENLKRAGVALQQMAGKGVVSMEELRQQLGESVPTAINAMADALGTSYSKLVKEISQGKVTSKPAILAMMQELELSFKGASGAMMNTWGGAVAQFETGMKRLAVSFGGLDKDGFAGNGYLKTVTHELKGINEVLSSPEMIRSAKELGQSLAELISKVASGTKWIIEHRDSIYEWGKALLYLWAAFKGATLIGGFISTAGAAMGRLSLAMIQMRMQGLSATAALRAQAIALTGFNSAAAIAAAGFVRIATGSNAAAVAVRILGVALGTLAGPIGVVIALAATLGYSWYENKKAANAATEAVLALNGALTDNAQLKILSDARDGKKKAYDDKFGAGASKFNGYASKEEAAAYEKEKKEAAAELKKIDEDFTKARLGVANSLAETDAQGQIAANSTAVSRISDAYRIDKENLREQFQKEAKKDGKKFDDDGFAAALVQLKRIKVQDEVALYEEEMGKAQEKINSLIGNSAKTIRGNPIMTQEQLQELQTAKKLLVDYREKASDAKDSLQDMGKVKLADTLVDPGAKAGKPAFDAMTIFVDGLRKKLATLDAKIDETNPYLAQLGATIESLGGKKLPNFDKVYSEGVKLAEQTWALEKAQKAVTKSSNEYKEAQERIGQIGAMITAKLAKAENLNPWEKASADAVRYEEELDEVMKTLEQTKRAAYDAQVAGAGAGVLKKLEEDAVVTGAKVDELKAKIEALKVSDTAKKMTEDAQSISDSLMSTTDRTKTEYDRQTAWADQFYAKHKEQLAQDGAAEAAYTEYRKQLTNQYMRDTESGLDAWIRQNKDATEQYKSLWGSAMDKFNDTLVDGMVNGKLELSSFVEYVLKEFLRIQMAKQMAMMAEGVSGQSGLLGTIASGIGSYFGGGGAAAGNGMAAGSAGAKSSSLGASQAGYSSKYFANGGIMTEYGELALKKYAKGGIAKTPQVAIYGEGSGAEAYVPLPDGRSIPVTMSGGAAGGGGAPATGAVPVEVNIYNQGGEQVAGSSNQSFDGEKMVIDVVLKQLSQPSAMRTAVKGVA